MNVLKSDSLRFMKAASMSIPKTMSENLPSKEIALSGRWRIANIRFTAFLDEMPAVKGDQLFQDFFGISPEAETHKRAEFLSEFSTARGPVLYQVSLAGPKIDFIATAGVALPDIPSELPALPAEGNFEQTFRNGAKRLAEQVSELRRVAVGEHFILSAKSKEDAYALMAKFLPDVRIDTASSSDFLYRINRPRNFDAGGKSIAINRLSQWSCMRLQIRIEAGSATGKTNIGDAVSLTTDINTVPEADFSNLSAESKIELIGNIFDFSRELAEKGDVA